MKKLKSEIKKQFAKAKDKIKYVEELRDFLYGLSEMQSQPVDRIRWVNVDEVEPNDYNPNKVAEREMGLLYTSILHDGYTQPIVTIYDEKKKKYIIVDGFHRYYICKLKKDIRERNKGLLPIVVINKDINDRMASTIRHNRARGEHNIGGMSNMVFNMLDNGWTDQEICKELGMEIDELIRLKHITGFSKLFENTEYRKAWETNKMIRIRHQFNKKKKEVKIDENGQ